MFPATFPDSFLPTTAAWIRPPRKTRSSLPVRPIARQFCSDAFPTMRALLPLRRTRRAGQARSADRRSIRPKLHEPIRLGTLPSVDRGGAALRRRHTHDRRYRGGDASWATRADGGEEVSHGVRDQKLFPFARSAYFS